MARKNKVFTRAASYLLIWLGGAILLGVLCAAADEWFSVEQWSEITWLANGAIGFAWGVILMFKYLEVL